MKNLLLFVMVHLVGATLNAQTGSVILGKWDVCVNMELNLEEDCSENSYVTYDFHENGTYSDNREYIIMGGNISIMENGLMTERY
ncbi:MAG: hypothetical protein HRT58_12270 [Crocinitomicaceae bacterium]|nr:hypothetical protein [Flavobacteriales bacterium]NQZ36437.1 hypothetical protein [Crocinitomicaceae bacterium]